MHETYLTHQEQDILIDFMNCDMNISKVAAKHHLHRYQIYHMFDEIREKTKLDPRCFYDLETLHMELERRKNERIEFSTKKRPAHYVIKNKAMFTLSLEGEKIQVCPTCYQIVKIESDRHKTKNIVNDPKYTLDRIYQMLSDSVIEQNHAMQQIALTIYKHIQQKELIRTNALIVGPTGSGKTEVARQVEKYCRKRLSVFN